jgi:cytidylate kinase
MTSDSGIRDILKGMIVTVDGFAGSGKSTTASLLAGRLGLRYIDTGSMYRGITLAILRVGADPEDEEAAGSIAESAVLELRWEDGKSSLYLDGDNVEKEIRSPGVSGSVSQVSRHPRVRRAMVGLQRSIAESGGVVAEGRDTGSVVFPHASVRVFLTAGVEERARRRQNQLKSMGVDQTFDEIRENIARRDAIDSQREHSPLVRPAGSILVDTSSLTIEQQVGIIEESVLREAARLRDLMIGEDEMDERARMRPYYRFSHALMRLVWKGLFGMRILGAANLRFRENFIFASNHLSYADPPIVGCGLNREVSFIAKKELFANRFFAWLIRTYHAIPIDRDEIDLGALKLIASKLRGGESILMFPEGTRSKSGDIGELKSGLGFIAIHTGVTVVPVHVSGTNDLLKCLFRARRLELRIGPPMRVPQGYVPDDRKAEYRRLSSMVQEELRMLKNESEA